MAKTRQLFNAVAVETAKRRRICHHNRAKHQIAAGERCLVIRGSNGNGPKNYCLECGTAILVRAEQDLAVLTTSLKN